jgi:hypothetical protein
MYECVQDVNQTILDFGFWIFDFRCGHRALGIVVSPPLPSSFPSVKLNFVKIEQIEAVLP